MLIYPINVIVTQMEQRKIERTRNCIRKPPLEFKITEKMLMETERPLDYSFKRAKELKGIKKIRKPFCVASF